MKLHWGIKKSGKLEVISLKNLFSKLPKLLKVLPNIRLPTLNFNNWPQLLRTKKWCAHAPSQSHQMELCLIKFWEKKDFWFAKDMKWSKALSRWRLPLAQTDMILSWTFEAAKMLVTIPQIPEWYFLKDQNDKYLLCSVNLH